MMPRRLATLSLLSAATALSATATRRSPLTVAPPSNDQLVIAGKTFNSRLFLGTGKYKTAQDMADSIAASEAEVVTVAVRRVEGAVTSMLETSIDWNKVWVHRLEQGLAAAEHGRVHDRGRRCEGRASRKRSSKNPGPGRQQLCEARGHHGLDVPTTGPRGDAGRG